VAIAANRLEHYGRFSGATGRAAYHGHAEQGSFAMPGPSDYVPLAGSERAPLPGAREIGPVDPQAPVRVSVILRRGGAADAHAQAVALADAAPAERSYVRRDEFAQQFGARDDDIAVVERFAEQAGLTVEERDAARRTIVLSGPAEAMARAFNVRLADYEHPEVGRYRGREGRIELPAEVDRVVTAVLGLDDRPQAKPRMRRAVEAAAGVAASHAPSGFTPPQVADLYDFPSGTGRGQCIAVVSLGGGIRDSDPADFFQSLGIAPRAISKVSVGGATIGPGGGAALADGENALDVEVSGGIATEAAIVVYFASNTTAGFHDAITTAIHDTTHRPSVISISWGLAEEHWTGQAMHAMDDAFVDAGLLGITVLAAAGDNGSADGIDDGDRHVDHPANSPHLTACGGTNLIGSGSVIASETVWNDGNGGATGGGVSNAFPLPSWQGDANVPSPPNSSFDTGRGVPDVAGDADPATGWRIRLGGRVQTFGGTSAVAPMWAGLVAILNERLGHRVGFLNPALYSAAAAEAFTDVVNGENAVPGTPGYDARTGWDPCTGLGSPSGNALLTALGGGGNGTASS
jgi:kumamolisin